ncbi:MAG: carbohydrate-binding protein, partial [Ideonella sp.]|nr:carbohydrate-binding protein [Ideonella sp.]
QAQAQASTDLLRLVSRHAPVMVVSVLIAAGLALAGVPTAWVVAFGIIGAATPLWVWLVSRPLHEPEDAALAPEVRAQYEAIARATWRYFERCVGADDHHLPPDNLQTDPYDALAHRTSPTNIGLYLLSCCCAQAFGWIDRAELLTRLEATLATLDRLARHCGHFLNWYDTQTLAPLLPMYVSTVDSGNLSGHLLAVAQACGELARGIDTPADERSRLQAAAARCERLAWEADYAFLYHPKRQLLHIGYRVAEQQLDAGFYDLLASESRLTSLLAIAKGDVPVRHWAALGRPFLAVGTEAGLRSWSGSMFEYLMPSLVLAEPAGSALHAACRAAVQEQIVFGLAHRVPWGVSESAYAGRDHTLAYQYAPQGVPRLALRRTPPDELVVAPYATLLAAQVAPRRALTNLAALDGLGARGALGYIEALDFTPARQAGTGTVTPVQAYMAHHQGMALVSLANVLLDGVARRWGMANPSIEAVASLLHERAPRELPVPDAALPGPPTQTLVRAPGMLREVTPGIGAVEPTHVLSNGRYSVALRANGAGWSRWGQAGITRWRDDALRDLHGSFFWLRWDRQPNPVSLSHHPSTDPAATYRSSFHADRVCFDTRWPELQATTTVWVSPEDDIEFRQVELRNLGERMLDLELLSAFDVTLADPRADESHPAFSNLFVRAEWLAEQQALWFERRPRLVTEQGLQAAHFLAETDPQVVQLRVQTDRQRWLGRNRPAGAPLADFDPLAAPRSVTALDTGLDPVSALAVQLRIPPGGKARLTFATAASDDAGTLRAVIDKYRQASHVQRASLMSATLTGIRLRTLRISAENFAQVQVLTTALVLSLTRPVAGSDEGDAGAPVGGVCDRRLLWRFGISGDRPVLLVTAGVMQGLGLLRSLAQALRLWAWGGIACDLVVVNAEAASYQMALQRELMALRERHQADHAAAAPTSATFHLLRAEELSADEWSTLQCLARIHLNADGRPLARHVGAWTELHEAALEQRDAVSTTAVPVAPAPGMVVPATVGRFHTASGEFRFDVSGLLRPVRPWINVLSNPGFGAQVSEAGGGYTWAVNSRLNQL